MIKGSLELPLEYASPLGSDLTGFSHFEIILSLNHYQCVKGMRALKSWGELFEVHIFRDMSSVHTSHTCRHCMANIAVLCIDQWLTSVHASLGTACV